jgi:hypothetical protein
MIIRLIMLPTWLLFAGLMAPETHPHLQPPPSWSAIPQDLAVLVLRLLPAYVDRARFAAVCPQWRAAARLPLPPPLPLLALPNGTFYSPPYTKPFRFPGCGFAGYQSVCGNWLVFPRDDGCFLVDPFSRATVTLPALSCVRLRPPNAVAERTDSDKAVDVTWMHIRGSNNLHISKLIVCSPNLVAAFVGFRDTTQILMCQPGALSWSVRAYDRCKTFEDMAFYQGKLYAIADNENLLVVNISEDHKTGDPQVSKIGTVIKGDPWYSVLYEDDDTTPMKKLYLVESCGALLMVRRAIWCRVTGESGSKLVAGQSVFEVFKADFEHSRWDKVTTVGDDQVLFLGRCSRAVSVSQYDFPGDKILFLDDDELDDYDYEDENSCVSTYHLRFRCVTCVTSGYPGIYWKRGGDMHLAAWLFPQDR